MAGVVPTPKPHKKAWPELVGAPELKAGLTIALERPGVTVSFLNVGDTRPPGFDPERVIVFLDANKLVAFTPRIG